MGTNSYVFEDLLNEHEVARMTGLSLSTLRCWRLLKLVPRFLKLGSSVRYRPVADGGRL
jgi:predicted DNA-binding transcriptional regulator AlpA